MKKKTIYIPEGSSAVQEKFINCMMIRGKKSTARRIMKDMLIEVSKLAAGQNPERVFEKALDNVKPSMEVRPKRIGGAVYQIPVEVKPNRQIALTFRWIIEAARNVKGKPMARKLAGVIMEASAGTGPAVKKKDDSHRMAQANKAFAHFAKY
ncbi:30S ribosomal protein S7 [Candidatus Peregrinibacteria bacterium]|nr:30S ribosomal protein S7 [Candidatus Peregrinibacteria bacterium]